MSAAFTPGPWSVESPMGDGEGDSLWIVEAEKPTYDWRCLAMVCSDDPHEETDLPKISVEERDANASLISAAPKLYEALLELASAVATTAMPEAACERLLPSCMKAQRELTKARGEAVAA